MKQVTLTSQGQITIPVEYRRQMKGQTKFLISKKDNTLILEPAVDVLTFVKDIPQGKTLQNKSMPEIFELEQQAIDLATNQDYLDKQKHG